VTACPRCGAEMLVEERPNGVRFCLCPKCRYVYAETTALKKTREPSCG